MLWLACSRSHSWYLGTYLQGMEVEVRLVASWPAASDTVHVS